MTSRRAYVWSGELIPAGAGPTGLGVSAYNPATFGTGDYIHARGDDDLNWPVVHGSTFSGLGVFAYIYNHVGPTPGTKAVPNASLDRYYWVPPGGFPNSHTDPLNGGEWLPGSEYFGADLSFLLQAHGDPGNNKDPVGFGGAFDPTITLKSGTGSGAVIPSDECLGQIDTIATVSGSTVKITLKNAHGQTAGAGFVAWICGLAPASGVAADPNLTGKHAATADESDPKAFRVTLPAAWNGNSGLLPGGMVVAPKYRITGLTNPAGNTVRITLSTAMPASVKLDGTSFFEAIWIGGVTGTTSPLNSRQVDGMDTVRKIDSTTIEFDYHSAPNLSGWNSDGFVFFKCPWSHVFAGEFGTDDKSGVLDTLKAKYADAMSQSVPLLATLALSSDDFICDGLIFCIGYNDVGHDLTSAVKGPVLRDGFRWILKETLEWLRGEIATISTGTQTAADVPIVLVQFGPTTEEHATDPTKNKAGHLKVNVLTVRNHIAWVAANLGSKTSIAELWDLPKNPTGLFLTGDSEIELGQRVWAALLKAKKGLVSSNGIARPVYFLFGQSQTSGPVSQIAATVGADPDFDGSWYDASFTTVVRQRDCYIWNFFTSTFEEYAPQKNACTYPARTLANHGNGAAGTNTGNVTLGPGTGGVGPEASLLLELRKRHPEGLYLIKLAVSSAALQAVAGLPTYDPLSTDLAVDVLEAWDRIQDWFCDAEIIPDVRGIFFDQGEGDTVEPYASNYQSALTDFITWCRAKLSTHTSSRAATPFVIGRLQDHDRIGVGKNGFSKTGVATVRAKQDATALAVANVGIADMDGLPIGSDDVHRTWRAVVESGQRLNNALDQTTSLSDAPELGQGASINPELGLGESAGAEAEEVTAGGGGAEAATTPSELFDSVDSVVATSLANGAVQSYEVDGVKVQRESLRDLMWVRRQLAAESAAARGGTRNYFRRGSA